MPHAAPRLRRLTLATFAVALVAAGCGSGSRPASDGAVSTGGAGGSKSTGGGGAPLGGGGAGGRGGGGKGGAPAEKVCGTIAGIVCGAGAFCELPVGTCGVPDGRGVCKPRSEVCPAIFAPVCGCDGKTYSSDCDRQGAGVSKGYDGTCATAGGGAGGSTTSPSLYTGCHFTGGSDRLVIAKYDAQASKCVTLVLADDSGIPAFTGLTISAPWYAESASLWPSSTSDCTRRDSPSGAAHATSASGAVTVTPTSSMISVDVTLSFRAGDAGGPQTAELKKQGVSTSASCL